MSGLELRCLGHYLSFFDKGAYADIVVNGDVHTLNQQAAGLPTRNNAKTFIYGFLYGAGPEKIGAIVNGSISVGRRLIKSFLAKTPAINALRNHVASNVGKGYIISLDGRFVPVRKPHAALNSLLQSAGAVICKRWLIGVYDSLLAQGLTYGSDFRIVAFIHDELQILVRKGLEETVGTTCQRVATQVGADLNMKCPLAAEYKVGNNWAETH
jgi:DNA polymerase I-like protein with 3'-5' exonuclease and polymerase domains